MRFIMIEVPLYIPTVMPGGGRGRLLMSEAHLQKMNRYRGTSFTRKRTPLGPYRRPMSRVLGWFQGVGRFLMGEVTL